MRMKTDRRSAALPGIIFALSIAGCNLAGNVDELALSGVNPADVRDGTYQGEQLNNLVTAKVEVIVENGSISSIGVLEHKHGPGHGADAIAEKVIAAQSLEVDAISGATTSSKVMLKAIEKALAQGL